MLFESRFSLDGCYRITGIGEIANNIDKNGEWVNAVNDKGETPLHIAARYKKFDLFNTMLPWFTNILACDNQGNTVMHSLLDNCVNTSSKHEKKCANVVQALMSKGANVNQKNRDGWTAIHLAARNCQIDVLRTLEGGEPDFTLRIDNGDSALHLACRNMAHLIDTPTEMEIINNLIIRGCDVNAKNNKGYSVLHYAVDWCGVRVIEKLIDCGADVDCRTNKLKLTALHLATRKKSLIAIDTLIKAGANINSVAHAGLTPLHFAVIIGSLTVVKSLVNHGADIDHTGKWAPLHLAIYNRRKDLFKYLVNEKANVNVLGVEGLAPLHLASTLGEFKFVKILIERGANVNCLDNNRWTPLLGAIKEHRHQHLYRLMENSVHMYLKDSSFAKYFTVLLYTSTNNNRKSVSRLLIESGSNVDFATKDGETSLHFGAELGNVKIVKTLLKFGANVDCREMRDGYTPLHTATYWNHVDVVKELVSANADLTIVSNDDKSVLQLAAFYNRVDIVKELISGNADVNSTAKDGKSALHVATTHNRVDVIRELLSANADVNVRAKDGKSPLHIAAEKSNPKIFKMLFKYGANVSCDDKRLGYSSLHIAAREDNVLMIQHLVKFGAKVNAVNDDGYTPLHCAADNNSLKAARGLIEMGAEVNCKTKQRQLTPLHLALQRRCSRIAEILIKANADVNVSDADGVTPLHLASLSKHSLEIPQLLIEGGADVNASDKLLQFTPLHVAINEENEATFDLLTDAGANVNVSDKNDLTPLHLAAMLANFELAEALIDCGANINCRDVSMYTPLHFAMRNSRVIQQASDKIYFNEASWISRSLRRSHVYVRHNSEVLIKFLIDLGADLHAQTKYGESLLHFAAETGSLMFVKVLMERGLDVNCKERRLGLTPLQIAALSDQKDVVEMLIYGGADAAVTTKTGKSLLHLATESGGTKVLQFLLRHGTTLDHTARRCPFMNRTSISDVVPVMTDVFDVKFNVDIKDSLGMTPLHLAALQSNRKRALDSLLLCGASTNVLDKRGFLPIHYAMKNNNDRQLQSLFDFGVDVNDYKVYSKIDLDEIGNGTAVGTCMLQHLMKLKALEFPIANVYEFILVELRCADNAFYNQCLKEVEKLKAHMIDSRVSMHDLLYVKRSAKCTHAKNINPRTIESEFPIYYSLILDFYHKTVVRESLIRKAESALFQLTEIDLPVVCVDKIFHNLGIISLIMLIEAADTIKSNKSETRCIEMEKSVGIYFCGLFYVMICKIFDACKLARGMFLTFMCLAVLFFMSVPKFLYHIINK